MNIFIQKLKLLEVVHLQQFIKCKEKEINQYLQQKQ